MYYSSFGILTVILHFIINYEILKNGRKEPHGSPRYRYRQFLDALLGFYVADLLWGFLAESGIRLIIWADTTIFFVMMALSVLLWTRFVVAFLDKRGIRARLFLGAGWGIFAFVIVSLIVNVFYPFVFEVTEEAQYVPRFGRYALLGLQLLLFLLISVYSLFVTLRAEGADRVHYRAVCVSGGVMTFFIVIQTLDAFAPFYTIGCFIASCLIHVFVEEDVKKEKDRIAEATAREKERYSQIFASLASDYAAIYYINIETGQYMEVSASESYRSMNVPKKGEDFYAETRENARNYVHPDDRDFAESMYYKETMLKNLEGRKSYAYKYRIMVGDEARYFRFLVMLSEDGKHFVLCDKDIHDTITAETALLEKQKISVTFSQIAESLASNYDVIYYVNIPTDEYVGYTSHNIYGELKVNESGSDFFAEAKKNVALVIHPMDRDRLFSILDKDYLITALKERRQVDVRYRHLINERVQYTSLSVRRSTDGNHLIIGVENIDEIVRREREHLRALNTEKELARRDELTGTRNKTACMEMEQSLQNCIDSGGDYLPFAIAVCDLNELKRINDTVGHSAGDVYIRSSAKLLCELFSHSPVFRIGGDEFAIFVSGDDYDARDELMERLHRTSRANRDRREGPVIAAGMAEYDPAVDARVTETFDRADRLMYEDKRDLKGVKGDGSL
ncbi:MAG: diguanylate cyclase [Lachnospiraceae bacterium]|nr:diguanylate cyclase [Lachnospiraceae bacterium]